MSVKWHENELNTLYEMAEAYTVKQIAFRLKRRGYYRTEMAITLKLHHLGFSTRPILDNYSCGEIARNLCLHSNTVIYWVQKGWLKAKKRCSTCYQIKKQDLKRFLNNPPQSLRTKIAELDPQVISYLVG